MRDPVQRVMQDLAQRGFRCVLADSPHFDVVAMKSGNTHRLIKVGRVSVIGKRELARAAAGQGDAYVAIAGSTTTLIAIPRAES